MIRRCQSIDELLEIGHLVYKCYLNNGYIDKNRYNLWLSHFQLLDDCEVYYMAINNKVVATGSLCFSDKTGIPSMYSYKDIISDKDKLAEVICFASVGNIKNTITMMVFLGKRTYDLGYDYLLIEVKEKHTKFYSKFFGFKKIGGKRRHYQVNEPVILMALDMRDVLTIINDKVYNRYVASVLS